MSNVVLEPWAIVSAMARAAASECITPWPPKPAQSRKPGRPGAGPTIAWVVGSFRAEAGPALAGVDGNRLEETERVADPGPEFVQVAGVEGLVLAGRIVRIGVHDRAAWSLPADDDACVEVDGHGNRGRSCGVAPVTATLRRYDCCRRVTYLVGIEERGSRPT